MYLPKLDLSNNYTLSIAIFAFSSFMYAMTQRIEYIIGGLAIISLVFIYHHDAPKRKVKRTFTPLTKDDANAPTKIGVYNAEQAAIEDQLKIINADESTFKRSREYHPKFAFFDSKDMDNASVFNLG